MSFRYQYLIQNGLYIYRQVGTIQSMNTQASDTGSTYERYELVLCAAFNAFSCSYLAYREQPAAVSTLNTKQATPSPLPLTFAQLPRSSAALLVGRPQLRSHLSNSRPRVCILHWRSLDDVPPLFSRGRVNQFGSSSSGRQARFRLAMQS